MLTLLNKTKKTGNKIAKKVFLNMYRPLRYRIGDNREYKAGSSFIHCPTYYVVVQFL